MGQRVTLKRSSTGNKQLSSPPEPSCSTNMQPQSPNRARGMKPCPFMGRMVEAKTNAGLGSRKVLACPVANENKKDEESLQLIHLFCSS